MNERLTRRSVIQAFGGLSLTGMAATVGAGPEKSGQGAAAMCASALPDKSSFAFKGTHLNAAYTHPLGAFTLKALEGYLQSRVRDAERNWPRENARDEAVRLFASLIGAQPNDIAVVPSTLEGENLVAASLGLGTSAGAVTDPFHYDASLILYGELHKQGMPLTVLSPRGPTVDYRDLDTAISKDTRLVAVSLVSSHTGHCHDLKTICEIAHGRGALVYADIIQAVGAVPLDVRSSGVDFCCAGTYKWLMGEFGTAFLYVRPDRLPALKRVQVGWRQIKHYRAHYPPADSPDPLASDYELGGTAAEVFEVSTPNWSALAASVGALNYLNDTGVERIAQYRAQLLGRLKEELPRRGFVSITPVDSCAPYVVYSREGAAARYRRVLDEAGIFVTLTENRMRVSVSVYNDLEDIERLIHALST